MLFVLDINVSARSRLFGSRSKFSKASFHVSSLVYLYSTLRKFECHQGARFKFAMINMSEMFKSIY